MQRLVPALDEEAHRTLVGEIELANRSCGVAGRVPDFGGRRFAGVGAPDRERYRSAGRGEHAGSLDSDSRACAGDDRAFSAKVDSADDLICSRASTERDLHARRLDVSRETPRREPKLAAVAVSDSP
jgi:hypothetical protein